MVHFHPSSILMSPKVSAAKLIVKYPSLTVTEYVDDLTEFVKKLYKSPQSENAGAWELTDPQKRMLVTNYIDTALNETMEKNMQRTVSSTLDDDNEFREYLKRVGADK